jgi:hypothetical protein
MEPGEIELEFHYILNLTELKLISIKLYSVFPPLSTGDMFQDVPWVPETYISYVFGIYTYLW